MKKYIYSVGIHKEGGLNILNKFIKSDKYENIYFLDERLKIKINKKNVFIIKNNLASRVLNLLRLSYQLKKDDHIIFLNGLPPVFKFRSEVSVFFQNANLFRKFYKISFLRWIFSRDFLRYLTFYLGKKNVNNWYVFSPISEKILSNNLKKYVSIKTLNIYEDYNKVEISNTDKVEYDFIYPASLMGHKNHNILFNTLISLSKKNIFPRVIFTLDPSSLEKVNFSYLKEKYNLKIFNYYENNHNLFLKIYKKCKCLLYMSSSETIGLPIIEAHKYGLFIIAPNLEYSHQFVQPDAKFDLNSENGLSTVIENCLETNFQNRKEKTFKIPIGSINLDDYMKKIL